MAETLKQRLAKHRQEQAVYKCTQCDKEYKEIYLMYERNDFCSEPCLASFKEYQQRKVEEERERIIKNKEEQVASYRKKHEQKARIEHVKQSWKSFVLGPSGLFLLLWGLLFALAIELEFGTVYFIASGFLLIFKNLRDGDRKPDEKSAYSVFNKDCEAIDGTLDPQQFEREIRYGIGST